MGPRKRKAKNLKLSSKEEPSDQETRSGPLKKVKSEKTKSHEMHTPQNSPETLTKSQAFCDSGHWEARTTHLVIGATTEAESTSVSSEQTDSVDSSKNKTSTSEIHEKQLSDYENHKKASVNEVHLITNAHKRLEVEQTDTNNASLDLDRIENGDMKASAVSTVEINSSLPTVGVKTSLASDPRSSLEYKPEVKALNKDIVDVEDKTQEKVKMECSRKCLKLDTIVSPTSEALAHTELDMDLLRQSLLQELTQVTEQTSSESGRVQAGVAIEPVKYNIFEADCFIDKHANIEELQVTDDAVGDEDMKTAADVETGLGLGRPLKQLDDAVTHDNDVMNQPVDKATTSGAYDNMVIETGDIVGQGNVQNNDTVTQERPMSVANMSSTKTIKYRVKAQESTIATNDSNMKLQFREPQSSDKPAKLRGQARTDSEVPTAVNTDQGSEELTHTTMADRITGQVGKEHKPVSTQSLDREIDNERVSEQYQIVQPPINETGDATATVMQEGDCDSNISDEVTDSQLCAMDIVPHQTEAHLRGMAQCISTRNQTSLSSLVVPGGGIHGTELEDGSGIIKGLIKEVAQLNKMLLKTRREIEAARRCRTRPV